MDKFTEAYIVAALWSSTVDDPRYPTGSDNPGGEPMDKHYSIQDIAAETLANMEADCKSFQNRAAIAGIDFDDDIGKQTQCSPEEYAGHDFWLTRNHHGCGFWDGDWKEPAATELTNLAHSFGECNLYVGDDGRICV